MDKLWNDQTISFGEKLRLLRSIVISVLLYGCESWTYKEELVKKINAFQFKCYRRLLGISWRYRRTNESVNQWKNRWETLPEFRNPTLKLRKNGKWNYSAMSQFRLVNTIMHGWFPGNRGRGRPRRCWITDIRESTRSTPYHCRLSGLLRRETMIQHQSTSTDPERSLV